MVWGVFGEYWRSRDRLINMKYMYLQCEVFGGLKGISGGLEIIGVLENIGGHM